MSKRVLKQMADFITENASNIKSQYPIKDFSDWPWICYIKLWVKIYVPEVLNVHMNENKKKSTFFRRIFFLSEKLTFEEENVIFFNTYLNFNLFYSIVDIFCKFRSYERSELQVH